MSIYLLHRTSKTNSVKYKIPCSDMQETIKSLKERFVQCLEAPNCLIELIYRGLILEDEQTLMQIGIKPDVVVHILTKPLPEPEAEPCPVSEEQIMQFHKFITFVNSHPHNKMEFMRINRPENLEKILKKVPALKDDPKAVAMLHDPFLITTLTDLKSLKAFAEDHPALIEAFRTTIDGIMSASNTTTQGPGTSTGFHHSLDPSLPESDSDSSGSEHSPAGLPRVRNNPDSASGITANQLLAALAFASGSNTATTSESSTRASSSSASTSNQNNSSIITTSMFNDALTQAMSQVRQPSTNNEPNRTQSRSIPGSSQSQNNSLATQLHRMREMGLTDDAINIQALVICNGDVQAAINLVFSGAIGNNEN